MEEWNIPPRIPNLDTREVSGHIHASAVLNRRKEHSVRIGVTFAGLQIRLNVVAKESSLPCLESPLCRNVGSIFTVMI